jgi:hypothetical protein
MLIDLSPNARRCAFINQYKQSNGVFVLYASKEKGKKRQSNTGANFILPISFHLTKKTLYKFIQILANFGQIRDILFQKEGLLFIISWSRKDVLFQREGSIVNKMMPQSMLYVGILQYFFLAANKMNLCMQVVLNNLC